MLYSLGSKNIVIIYYKISYNTLSKKIRLFYSNLILYVLLLAYYYNI